MKRASRIKHAGEWAVSESIDRVVLDADERTRRRIVLTGDKGTSILLDLESPMTLRDGDGLVLDDGSIVAVMGMPEPLMDVASESKRDLLRFAWHIGNRHTGLQIVGDKLRVRRDHVLEDMLRQMGATLTQVEAPFEPEAGSHPQHGPDQHGE